MSRTRNGVRNGDVTHDVTHTEGRAGGPSSSTSPSLSSNDNGRGISNAARKVDQNELPDAFPDGQRGTAREVLAILHDVWEVRGGSIEPRTRGVGLGMLRNLHAPHIDVARRLQHWLVAGKGQRASTADIAKRFGDWCADEPAGSPARPASGSASGRRESASDWLREINAGSAA